MASSTRIETYLCPSVPAPDNRLPSSGAPIEGGRYVVNAKGGVPVGTHRIQIEAYRVEAGPATAVDSTGASAEMAPPRRQYLPAKYNTKSALEITIPSGSGRITRDFDLTE